MFLNCHSYYSLRYGVLSIEELVAAGKAAGADVLCLTDINAMTGVYAFAQECRRKGIKPVVGIEFREGNSQRYVGLARNLEGFAELNRFLSERNLAKSAFPKRAPIFNHVYVIYPQENLPTGKLRDHEYIGVRPREVNALFASPLEAVLNKLVVFQTVTLDNRQGFNLHRLLRCVDQNTLISKLEPDTHCDPSEWMVGIDRLLDRYERYPQIVLNTMKILSHCLFEFDFEQRKNMATYTGSAQEDKEKLERLAMEGLKRRYGLNNKRARERTERELRVIDNLGFAAYFLTAWDVVQHSMSLGLHHVGRGSGANSIIAYALCITDVCPLELDLYFERFLNPARTSPPDFDIDWSWKDRDTILEYIFTKFKSEHTAFVGTIGTFKHRSISQELGKVFGLEASSRKQLSGQLPEAMASNMAQRISEYATRLTGFPNLRSMHSCGIVITEQSKYNYLAVELPPKGFPTAQIDMYQCEDINLEKLDILSQRGLGHIADAVKLVERNQGKVVDVFDVDRFKRDEQCNNMLKRGQTIGCFYIESPAMRGLLRRLKCANYLTLVAASSIIRPGVAKSGMMREYIERHKGKAFNYPHPVFEEHLSDTYGVMVYQEDVIKVAHYFAGLDLSDADILRRSMSGKKRQTAFDGVKERYFMNCKKRGYPEKLTQEVYRQIESFAGYSFCKSHSASYAVESYQSLFLKAHYPLEFIVAVINNFGGFYRTGVYVHEARMSGGEVLKPCVNHSEVMTELEGQKVWLGFQHIKALSSRWKKAIPHERQKQGPYQSLEDFINRVPMESEQLQLLIKTGAFRFTGKPKGALLWSALLQLRQKEARKQRSKRSLFEEPLKQYKLPDLDHNEFEEVFDEIEHLEMAVTKSPFELLRDPETGDTVVGQFMEKEKQRIQIVGFLISRKPVPTARGDMSFGTWIDRDGAYFDTTHFPEVLRAYPFNNPGCYLIKGQVVIDYEFPMVEVTSCVYLPIMPDPRYPEAHTTMPVGKRDNLPFRLGRKPYPSNAERKKRFG